MRSDRHSSAILTGALLAMSVYVLGFALVSPALAGDCNTDIGNLSKKRQAIIEQLNKISHSSPKGQLDPVAACPKLRDLAVVEQQLSAYLTKNKDWCMVPDAAVENIDKSAKHTRLIAGQACKVAAQIKKSQEAIGAGPKLPSGPL